MVMHNYQQAHVLTDDPEGLIYVNAFFAIRLLRGRVALNTPNRGAPNVARKRPPGNKRFHKAKLTGFRCCGERKTKAALI